MSVVWSGVTESGAVVPVQVDGLGRVIATTGESPQPPVIEYSGASAWAMVEDGVLLNGLNIASYTKQSEGLFDVVFSDPMPSAEYSVVAATSNRILAVEAGSQTATGFTLESKNNGALYDPGAGNFPVSFQVYATNALPPMGGTGTDAWVQFNGLSSVGTDCTIAGSFNVERVEHTGAGKYEVYFVNDMPNTNYACLSSGSTYNSSIYPISASSFQIRTFNASGDASDPTMITATVNATNATLPLTVTKEQLDAVINNWQKTADTLSTKDAVEMNGPVRFAGGKAGVTSTGEFYFTPGPGSEKYLLGVDDGQMKLKRIDSVY